MSAADDGGATAGLDRPAEPAAAARARKTRTPRLPARAANDLARSRRTSRCSTPSFPACPIRSSCSIRTAGSSPSTREAAALAPALRRGEPASIALRMPELVEAIRAASLTGKAQRIEFSARLPSPRWSEAFVAPVALPAAAGRAGVVVITVHDLTPIRRVEEMRADFVANVSHELRTPLAALTGFIETLQGPARDDPAARERFLGIMQAQAWRMARLIDDLLSLSRIELRAHQRPDTPVDLVPIVRQVADGLQTLARDRGVAVEVAAPAEPLMVLGDRDELIRLFENLIENGLKYGASGKRVEIALARRRADGKGEARVSVRDYGPGIAAEHLPRLTERFYRVDVGESRAQGGTGLGPRAGQAHPQPPPRPAFDRQQGGRGRDLHGAPADRVSKPPSS